MPCRAGPLDRPAEHLVEPLEFLGSAGLAPECFEGVGAVARGVAVEPAREVEDRPRPEPAQQDVAPGVLADLDHVGSRLALRAGAVPPMGQVVSAYPRRVQTSSKNRVRHSG